MIDRLGADERLGLETATIARLVAEAKTLSGIAEKQVTDFCQSVREELTDFPEAQKYSPGAIL